jgi:DNA-binding transcriptional regulator YhcF (GntR family)
VTTSIRLTLRPGDGPASAQVREAIRRTIERGTLAPGDRLAPVRVAAVDLGLAPNTVARAYRELETDGWLVGRGRAGTFVADTPPAPQDPRAALDGAARGYLRRAAALGFSRADARQALEDAR